MAEWAAKHGPRSSGKFANVEITRNMPSIWLEQ
jgi:hypothetical protein